MLFLAVMVVVIYLVILAAIMLLEAPRDPKKKSPWLSGCFFEASAIVFLVSGLWQIFPRCTLAAQLLAVYGTFVLKTGA